MPEIILITGGQRSGKSAYAQKMALSMSSRPVYLATSRIWDDEHKIRIERHKRERGLEWENIEEEKKLSKNDFTGKVVLVDCITLWATNFFFDLNSATEQALCALKEEFDKFITQEARFIFVTNEIGMGEMPQNEIQRKFTDLQGWINQYIAGKADKVFLMVAGIPLQVK